MSKHSLTYYIEAARSYLTAARNDLAVVMPAELRRCGEDPLKIIAALMPHPRGPVEKGVILNREFRLPHLAQKYPREKMTLFVPQDYTHRKPRRLIIVLHGGGKCLCAEKDNVWTEVGAEAWLKYEINDLFTAGDAIVCFPCAPYHAVATWRWNLAQVEDYLLDVIAELEQVYRIAHHGMFLLGQSMGGFGGYHLLQRMSDVFAGFGISAGAWNHAFWPCATGTDVWLFQGANDAVLYKRKHWTDVEYARQAFSGLKRAGVSCVYREHAMGHAFYNTRPALREWLGHIGGVCRDPFHPHVVAVSPRGDIANVSGAKGVRGNSPTSPSPAPHCRWITLGRIWDEALAFEYAPSAAAALKYKAAADWDDFSLPVSRKNVRGGIVEAHICGNGIIEAAARNVEDFTLWLHPSMLDLNNVTLRVNGRVRFTGTVKLSLATALESYLRRRDWGLIYPARVTIMKDDSWQSKDQIGIKK